MQLLKEQLEIEKVKQKDGTIRHTIKCIDELLPFDKVWKFAKQLSGTRTPERRFLLLQGFYVFVRALQLMKTHNDGVILVRKC